MVRKPKVGTEYIIIDSIWYKDDAIESIVLCRARLVMRPRARLMSGSSPRYDFKVTKIYIAWGFSSSGNMYVMKPPKMISGLGPRSDVFKEPSIKVKSKLISMVL